MKIVVLDGYTLNPGDNPWDAIASLGEVEIYDRSEPEEVIERAKSAEVVLTNKTVLSEATINQLPNLRYIAVLATGVNVIDLNAARSRGIPVSNVPEYSTESVAQFTFGLLLELCHRVGHHDHAVKSGAWSRQKDFCFWDFPLYELAGRSMGLVGFGRIGQSVGRLAHAFHMRVLASSRSQKPNPDYPVEWMDIPNLFSQADVVSLHCPQTQENLRFANASLFSTMQPSAFFINTARGPLVNEVDLADALNQDRIAGAALDVLSQEPPDPNHPLLTAKNCIVTPHMAWGTLAARKRLMQTTADNIKAFQSGKPMHVVNP